MVEVGEVLVVDFVFRELCASVGEELETGEALEVVSEVAGELLDELFDVEFTVWRLGLSVVVT